MRLYYTKTGYIFLEYCTIPITRVKRLAEQSKVGNLIRKTHRWSFPEGKWGRVQVYFAMKPVRVLPLWLARDQADWRQSGASSFTRHSWCVPLKGIPQVYLAPALVQFSSFVNWGAFSRKLVMVFQTAPDFSQSSLLLCLDAFRWWVGNFSQHSPINGWFYFSTSIVRSRLSDTER